MPRKSSPSPAQLPQSTDRWLLTTTQLRVWVAPPGVAPNRPHLIIILSSETGSIRAHEITKTEPSAADVRNALRNALQKPLPGSGKPERPEGIIVTSEPLGNAIVESFKAEPLGVHIYFSDMPGEVLQIIRDLEERMRGKPELPGLLSVKAVTPEQLASFYAAAADYFRAAPWVHLANIHVLALRHSAEREFRYVIVMGNGGMEYGMMVYRRWADVERIFSGDGPPLALLPDDGAHSLSFEPIHKVPFEDLDALQQHGWEIAADDAYPVAIVTNGQGDVRRPNRADLLWYEAALRAIPLLVRDHLRSTGRVDFQPLETTLTVPTHAGEVNVMAKYPAGKLPLADQPAQRLDWSDDDAEAALPFDRRAMEGMMFQAARDMGASTSTGDRKLAKAQELMYRAWEESNPAKRIALAHDALVASPNCADAYVLLAEEQAPNVEHALEYYRQGVTAGERALGKEYFAENEGDFWGLLETRPYMRARTGLADALWQLQQYDEAITHYNDLLRLNPGDNQGIRYLLLNLLTRLERDADVEQLLAQFEDDAGAAWLYASALHEFRRNGASERGNEALREALQENKHVPAYLTGAKRIPHALPQMIGFGDENEAIAYAADHINSWRRTTGALEWLTTQAQRKSALAKKPVKRRGAHG